MVPNGAPIVETIVDKFNFEGDEVNYQVVASDPDNDPLTYSATGLASGLSINESTGVITGTVSADAGSWMYDVVVSVSDSTNSPVTASFDWVIASLGEIDNQTFELDADVWLPVHFDNPHELEVSFSATGLADGLTIESETGLISGVPTEHISGTATITAHVGDTDWEEERTFDWVVVSSPSVTTPGEQWTNINDAIELSTENENAIAVDSGYGSSTVLEINLEVNDGTLTLAQTTGLSFTTGDGTGDASMTFSGTVTNINAALDGLTFTPATDFRGEAIIEIEASDPNHNDANDDPLTAFGEVGIAVGGPVILVPDTQATNSSQPLVFSWYFGNGIFIIDPPAGEEGLEVTLEIDDGTLTLGSLDGLAFDVGDGENDVTMTFTGLLDDVNRALEGMFYVPSSAYLGTATLDIAVTDLGEAWDNGTELTEAAVEIEVGGPSIEVPGNQWTDEDTALEFSISESNAITVANEAGSSADLEVTLSASNGTLTLAQTTGLTFTQGTGTDDPILAFSGSAADINDALDGLTFTPTEDFLGEANLFISAAEAEGELDQTAYAGVLIVVGGEIVALDDEAETILDQPITIDVLANDISSVDGELTINIITSPTNGTITVEDGKVIYTPAEGWYGSESFSYSITDEEDNTDVASVEVTVVELQAVPDEVEVEMNEPLTIDVLDNDIGTGISIVSVTQPSFGTAEIDGGNIVFTPNEDFQGVDVIGYAVGDSEGHTSWTTASVFVFDPQAPEPEVEADDDEVVVAKNTPLTINVLDNDENYVGEPEITQNASHGFAEVDENGNIVYEPGENYTGPDSFEYEIWDGDIGYDTAVVFVTVQSVVVLIDINETAERSDDVAFLDVPIPVRLQLLAPDTSGEQTIIIRVMDLFDEESEIAEIFEEYGDPTTELTLSMEHEEVVEIWLRGFDESSETGDVRLVAFHEVNNVEVELNEKDADSVQFALGAGYWTYPDGNSRVDSDNTNKIFNANTSPAAMVTAGQYRVQPRTDTLFWVSVSQALGENRKVTLKVTGQSDDNGRIEFRKERAKTYQDEMVLTGDMFNHQWPNNPAVKNIFATLRGKVATINNQEAVYQTKPGVNPQDMQPYAGRLKMVIPSNADANIKGAESAGFSVAAIPVQIKVKRSRVIEGSHEDSADKKSVVFTWAGAYDSAFISDSLDPRDLSSVLISEQVRSQGKGYFMGLPDRHSKYQIGSVQHEDLHGVEQSYQQEPLAKKVAAHIALLNLPPELLNNEAVVELLTRQAIGQVQIDEAKTHKENVATQVQWFIFYDLRTGSKSAATVKESDGMVVRNSGFKVTLTIDITRKLMLVNKSGFANNNAQPGLVENDPTNQAPVQFIPRK